MALSAAYPAAAALAALCLPVAPAAAQDRAAVVPGERVRVVVPATNGGQDQYVTGTLGRLAGDTVTILVNPTGWRSDSLRYALNDSAGRRLEHIVATRSHGGRDMALGAVIGGTTGALIAAATYEPCTGLCWDGGQGLQAAGGAFVGGLGGALIGLVIGSASHTETWGPVPTSGVRIGVAQTSARLAITF